MTIGLLEANFSIPEAYSLKDKRQVVRSMRDRVKNRFNISVGEVGKQDYWKSARFAFVTVAGEKKIVEKRISELITFLHSDPRLILLSVDTSYL